MNVKRPSNPERSEATRAALLAAARELFTERGFAGVGTEEIVRRADVTRGALYHHFSDKRDLFRAVHESIEEELVGQIGARMAGIEDPVEQLNAGVVAFLDLCLDPTHTRIPLLEAPAVLGWEEWRAIDMRYSLGLVTAGLEAGMEAGALRPQAVRPVAHLLVAAMGEAGIMIATSPDPAATRAEIEPALFELVAGLRERTND